MHIQEQGKALCGYRRLIFTVVLVSVGQDVSTPAPKFEHVCQKTLKEKASYTDRQEVIQQSSEALLG